MAAAAFILWLQTLIGLKLRGKMFLECLVSPCRQQEITGLSYRGMSYLMFVCLFVFRKITQSKHGGGPGVKRLKPVREPGLSTRGKREPAHRHCWWTLKWEAFLRKS